MRFTVIALAALLCAAHDPAAEQHSPDNHGPDPLCAGRCPAVCKSEADADKPECADCAKCHDELFGNDGDAPPAGADADVGGDADAAGFKIEDKGMHTDDGMDKVDEKDDAPNGVDDEEMPAVKAKFAKALEYLNKVRVEFHMSPLTAVDVLGATDQLVSASDGGHEFAVTAQVTDGSTESELTLQFVKKPNGEVDIEGAPQPRSVLPEKFYTHAGLKHNAQTEGQDADKPEDAVIATALNEGWSLNHPYSMGLKLEESVPMDTVEMADDLNIPANYDVTQAYPACRYPTTNQGSCGSCYSFSATLTLAMRRCVYDMKATGQHTQVPLSQQTMVACSNADKHCMARADACQGASLTNAWEFLDRYGVDSEAADPYTSGGGNPLEHMDVKAGEPGKCKDTDASNNYKALGYYSIKGEREIQAAILAHGPVDVGFNVYGNLWQWKGDAVWKPVGAKPEGAHAVVVYGWGVNAAGEKYWLIQNSWGNNWGNQGTFRLYRGADTDATVKKIGLQGRAIGPFVNAAQKGFDRKFNLEAGQNPNCISKHGQACVNAAYQNKFILNAVKCAAGSHVYYPGDGAGKGTWNKPSCWIQAVGKDRRYLQLLSKAACAKPGTDGVRVIEPRVVTFTNDMFPAGAGGGANVPAGGGGTGDVPNPNEPATPAPAPKCPAGTFSPTGSSPSCQDCPPGTYADTAGATACKGAACAAGRFARAGSIAAATCTNCAPGKFAGRAGSTTCTMCAAGKSSATAGSIACTDCAPGKFAGRAGSTTCTACAKDTYSGRAGSTSCNRCVSGTDTRSQMGATACQAKEKCKAGKYRNYRSDSCDVCVTGRYQNQEGKSFCKYCLGGKFSATAGATDCSKCAAGRYSRRYGSASCTDCAKNQYQDQAGMTYCKRCRRGTFTDQAGQIACKVVEKKVCDAGKFDRSNNCQNCPGGKYSPKGRTYCSRCGYGKASSGGAATCTACSKGKYAYSGRSSCTTCPTGKYNDLVGKWSCKRCPRGKSTSTDATSCASKATATTTAAATGKSNDNGGGGGGAAKDCTGKDTRSWCRYYTRYTRYCDAWLYKYCPCLCNHSNCACLSASLVEEQGKLQMDAAEVMAVEAPPAQGPLPMALGASALTLVAAVGLVALRRRTREYTRI